MQPTRRGNMNWRNLGKAAACLLAIQALLIGSTTLPAAAQSAPTSSANGSLIAVSPPLTETTVDPGKGLTQTVSLINGSDVPRTFTTSVQNFEAKGDNGAGDLIPDVGPYSLSAWMKVTPEKQTIPPSGTAQFTVTINLPADAGPGGHFGGILFTPVVNPAGGDSNVSVVAQVSSVFLINVPGAITHKASVTSFKADKSFYSKGPVSYTIEIKNEGNVIEHPSGTITITNQFGSKVATLKVDAQRVLPDSSRKFTIPWDHKTILGSYKAKLDWNYGDAATPIKGHATTTIYGAPLTTIYIIVAIIVVLFVLVWLPRKRVRRAISVLAASGKEGDDDDVEIVKVKKKKKIVYVEADDDDEDAIDAPDEPSDESGEAGDDGHHDS